MLSTQEVALRYHVKNREVLYAVNKGLISARKVGWSWIFNSEELPKKWPVRSKKLRGKKNC